MDRLCLQSSLGIVALHLSGFDFTSPWPFRKGLEECCMSRSSFPSWSQMYSHLAHGSGSRMSRKKEKSFATELCCVGNWSFVVIKPSTHACVPGSCGQLHMKPWEREDVEVTSSLRRKG